MKLYFVRHAESEANLNNAYNYDRDSLSPLGRRQAKAIAKRLSKIPIDLILSSDLIRAEETAAIISKAIGVKTRLRIFFSPSLAQDDFQWRIPELPYASIGKASGVWSLGTTTRIWDKYETRYWF